MNDRFNTIAGWVLFAGIVALGGSILSTELFKSHEVHGGYPVEGAAEAGGKAAADERPIEFYLASADVAKGEQVFKKCTACHNADQGGANALGPSLYGVMGNPVAAHPGFAFSDALKSKGGTWDWTTMSEWLASPKRFAPGTKMTFAGLSNPEDRANVMAFLNARDSAPMPLPEAPAEDAAPAPDADVADAAPKPGSGTGDGPQKAENEPQTNAVRSSEAAGTGE